MECPLAPTALEHYLSASPQIAAAYQDLIADIRASKSKHRDAPPESFQWKFVWVQALGGLPDREPTTPRAVGQVPAGIYLRLAAAPPSGRARGSKQVITDILPQELIDHYDAPYAPAVIGPGDIAIQLQHNGRSRDTYLVLGGYLKPVKGGKTQTILCLQKRALQSSGLLYAVNGHMLCFCGGFAPTAEKRFLAAKPGESFKFRNKSFHKLTLEELRAATAPGVFQDGEIAF